MATPAEFAAECRDISRAMRRLPTDLKRALRPRSKLEVAEPMAADVRRAGRTVYATRVAATTRVRSDADPTLVVGGARRILSGGARGHHVVWGIHFTAGKRVTAVPATARRRGYRRRSTNQFIGRRDPFVFTTVYGNAARYLELWADIITDEIGKALGNGKQ